jgi:hypothetical protein
MVSIDSNIKSTALCEYALLLDKRQVTERCTFDAVLIRFTVFGTG